MNISIIFIPLLKFNTKYHKCIDIDWNGICGIKYIIVKIFCPLYLMMSEILKLLRK